MTRCAPAMRSALGGGAARAVCGAFLGAAAAGRGRRAVPHRTRPLYAVLKTSGVLLIVVIAVRQLGFQRSLQHLSVQGVAMAVPKDRPRPGPGAPLTAERERYLRLVAQGMSNYRACREIGVHPTTGMRWRDGRKMVDSSGRARYYPPIAAPPVVISARFLSEDERVLIGDLLRAGHSVRSIAARLGRSPSTISREVRRNAPDVG